MTKKIFVVKNEQDMLDIFNFLLATEGYTFCSFDNPEKELESEHKIIGLLVDEVSDALDLKPDKTDATPVNIGYNNDLLWGFNKPENKLLVLLNPQHPYQIPNLTIFKN